MTGGVKNSCALQYEAFSKVLPKSKIASVEQKILLPESVAAPVKEGDSIGTVSYLSDGEQIGQVNITAVETVEKIDFFEILRRMLAGFLLI